MDENHAITNAMFRHRLAGYRELNYSIEMPEDEESKWLGADTTKMERREVGVSATTRD